MTSLVPGQNCALSGGPVRVDFGGAGAPGVLLLDGQRRATGYLGADQQSVAPGVAVGSQADIDLAALSADVERVLCVVLNPVAPTGLLCRLRGGDAEPNGEIEFNVAASELFPAIIGFELYRRDGSWRARAVGQGYAGGIGELLSAHHYAPRDAAGRDGTRPGLTPPPPPAVPPAPPPPPPARHDVPPPLGDSDPLERIAMIHEDAVRMTAAFTDARAFAEDRHDAEMSAAVADPAARTSPTTGTVFAAIGHRRDELVDRARADYQRDAAYLGAELAVLDTELPPALASWSAPSWQRPSRRGGPGIRLGVMFDGEAGPLDLPFCVPVPLRRPVWVDEESPESGSPVASSVVMRLLAAQPEPDLTVDIVDIGRQLRPLCSALGGYLRRPVVTDPTEAVDRLRQLASAADLAALRLRSEGTVPPPGIIVITNFGFALPESVLGEVAALINLAAEARLSLVFTGESDWQRLAPAPLLREISEVSLPVPAAAGARILDPWTRRPWEFRPDALGGAQLDQVARALFAAR